MGGVGIQLRTAAWSLEVASLSRIWEARKVHRKCTGSVVGHN